MTVGDKITEHVTALRRSLDELGLLIEADPKKALVLLDRVRDQLEALVSAFEEPRRK